MKLRNGQVNTFGGTIYFAVDDKYRIHVFAKCNFSIPSFNIIFSIGLLFHNTTITVLHGKCIWYWIIRFIKSIVWAMYTLLASCVCSHQSCCLLGLLVSFLSCCVDAEDCSTKMKIDELGICKAISGSRRMLAFWTEENVPYLSLGGNIFI